MMTKKEITNFSSLDTILSNDLIATLLAHVAASSHKDLCNFKQTCRVLNELGCENQIFSCVSLEEIPIVQWVPKPQMDAFIQHCVDNENPEALYRLGIVEYFTNNNVERGFEILAKAKYFGHEEATYILGILLLCTGGDISRLRGIELLNKVEGNKMSKHTGISESRQKCKKILWQIWKNHLPQQPQQPICTNVSCNQNRRLQIQGWKSKDEIDYNFDCEACKWDHEVSLFRELFCNT